MSACHPQQRLPWRHAFTAFAFSGAPIRICAWTSAGFRQVTNDYRSAIRDDAALWLRRYRRAPRSHEPQGVLADQYRLGQRAGALRFVRKEVSSGKLRSMPDRRTFVRRLATH